MNNSIMIAFIREVTAAAARRRRRCRCPRARQAACGPEGCGGDVGGCCGACPRYLAEGTAADHAHTGTRARPLDVRRSGRRDRAAVCHTRFLISPDDNGIQDRRRRSSCTHIILRATPHCTPIGLRSS